MDEEVKTTEVRTEKTHSGDTDVERQTVATENAAPTSVIAKRIVYYFVGIIVALLLLRIVLLLLAANQGNAFVDFIYAVGGIFAAPFFGMFSYTPVYGSSVFEVSSVVAILVYLLVGWGIAKLFTLGSNSRAV
ncbi:MAG: hypothetical protein UY35_C0007G0032 [Candidatus Saccharibacteria bacterium GW2011_GWC2_48_9]|nr:MAG: hypothetical protein UY35_C0007G0032 [Candidatus Saccharibacteria bacterium GW2011_GWC2_48_9]HCH34686.1 hypothetical protein [Candidatus Saccharibacteria bacterium]